MTGDVTPRWAREIVKFLPVKPQFVLWGNVYDVYPIRIAGGVTTMRMIDYLRALFRENGYALLLEYEPIYGFSLLEGDSELCRKVTGEKIQADRRAAATLTRAAQIIERLVDSKEGRAGVIMNFSSRIPDIGGNDVHEFYYRLFRLSQRAIPKMTEGEGAVPMFNAVTWVLDKENDLPGWYTLDNPRVQNLPVPKPDYQIRKIVVESLARNIDGFQDLAEEKQRECESLFIDQTGGLHASEIISIVSLARRERIPFSGIAGAIRMYKLGIVENPWSKIDVGKIAGAEDRLGRRVMGQPGAVRKASDIIKRAVFNLSGSQYAKFSQRPKGVLFFAGPTGVGKTELAKALTELIFGSETSCLRFDMSEFAREHADQRLLGAPPGYVGYDVGGELTSAVKQNPFAVVLFDEIEKAHPRILDIFLQILDDGRLTSGRGETVYFSESLVIFTSNLGMTETAPDGTRIQKVTPAMTREEIDHSMKESIEDFFRFQIGRPEILNRIGENIVVFDFIREEVSHRIFAKMLGNVTDKLSDTYGITVEFAAGVPGQLRKACCEDLAMGGRGIGNKLEQAFVNPLSRALFREKPAKGGVLVVEGLEGEGTAWELRASTRST